MMDGITVLTESSYTLPDIIGSVILIILTGTFVVWLVWLFTYHLLNENKTVAWVVAGMFAIVVVVVGCLDLKDNMRTTYEVTIDDTVPFTELYENYEIIKKDQKIYTIRERE